MNNLPYKVFVHKTANFFNCFFFKYYNNDHKKPFFKINLLSIMCFFKIWRDVSQWNLRKTNSKDPSSN